MPLKPDTLHLHNPSALESAGLTETERLRCLEFFAESIAGGVDPAAALAEIQRAARQHVARAEQPLADEEIPY